MGAKTLEEALKAFEQALPYIPERYEAGVKKADWYGPASSDEAESNFASAMSTVIAEKRRQKAIAKLSNAFWQTRSIEKGKPVIADRIRKALTDWKKNFGEVYSEVLALLPTLPKRTLDPMTNIDNRLKPVVSKFVEAAKKRKGLA